MFCLPEILLIAVVVFLSIFLQSVETLSKLAISCSTIFSSSALSKQLTRTTPLVCESHLTYDIHTIDVNRLITAKIIQIFNNLAGYEEMVGDVSQSETERYLLCMFKTCSFLLRTKVRSVCQTCTTLTAKD